MSLFIRYKQKKYNNKFLFYFFGIMEWFILLLILNVIFDKVSIETLLICLVTAISLGICGNLIKGGYQVNKNDKKNIIKDKNNDLA